MLSKLRLILRLFFIRVFAVEIFISFLSIFIPITSFFSYSWNIETNISKSIAKRSFPLCRIFELLALRNRLPKTSFFLHSWNTTGYCYRNGNRGICRFPLTDHFISFRIFLSKQSKPNLSSSSSFYPFIEQIQFHFPRRHILYRIRTLTSNRVKFEIISLFLFVTVFFIGRIRLHPCLREYRGKPFFIAAQTLTRYCEASSFHYKAVVDAFLTAENRSELVRTESEKLGTTYKVLEHA